MPFGHHHFLEFSSRSSLHAGSLALVQQFCSCGQSCSRNTRSRSMDPSSRSWLPAALPLGPCLWVAHLLLDPKPQFSLVSPSKGFSLSIKNTCPPSFPQGQHHSSLSSWFLLPLASYAATPSAVPSSIFPEIPVYSLHRHVPPALPSWLTWSLHRPRPLAPRHVMVLGPHRAAPTCSPTHCPPSRPL